MTNTCWCRPFIQNRKDGTLVSHNQTERAALAGWPFASQQIAMNE